MSGTMGGGMPMQGLGASGGGVMPAGGQNSLLQYLMLQRMLAGGGMGMNAQGMPMPGGLPGAGGMPGAGGFMPQPPMAGMIAANPHMGGMAMPAPAPPPGGMQQRPGMASAMPGGINFQQLQQMLANQKGPNFMQWLQNLFSGGGPVPANAGMTAAPPIPPGGLPPPGTVGGPGG